MGLLWLAGRALARYLLKRSVCCFPRLPGLRRGDAFVADVDENDDGGDPMGEGSDALASSSEGASFLGTSSDEERSSHGGGEDGNAGGRSSMSSSSDSSDASGGGSSSSSSRAAPAAGGGEADADPEHPAVNPPTRQQHPASFCWGDFRFTWRPQGAGSWQAACSFHALHEKTRCTRTRKHRPGVVRELQTWCVKGIAATSKAEHPAIADVDCVVSDEADLDELLSQAARDHERARRAQEREQEQVRRKRKRH